MGGDRGARLPPWQFGLLTVVVCLAVVAGVVTAAGRSPVEALRALALGSVGSAGGLAGSLAEATPLLFTGLAAALAFRAGVWNIGGEGQFLAGMLAAAAVALPAGGWPPVVAAGGALLAGMAAGAAWAAFPALLRAFRGAPEVITTIMANFVAVYLLNYCVQDPLRDRATEIPRTEVFPRAAWLPTLVAGSDIHLGLVVALGACLLLQLLFFRTPYGLRIRAAGLGPAAAQAAGIPVARVAALAFVASGALAGLGGAAHALGAGRQLYLYQPGEPGYGYTGVAAALLGGTHPVATAVAALLFGGLAAGSQAMQREAGVSFQLAYVVQALILFALLLAPRRRP